MIRLVRTDSSNNDFVELVKLLDKELQIRDGSEHSFYSQYNKIDKIKNVVVAYEDDVAVGCGAIKEYESNTMEVKRMFVKDEYRSKGIATKILIELELWAGALGYNKCILETGLKQPEAIHLYKKNNYKVIPNYGQYAGVVNSVCMEKVFI
ncbi:MAG: GNAT family N-acetyltransferase [Ignavibacteriales bacterium]|nr:GNAT family N-acetyltransferase [Ignavibacteriales bacterium]